MQILKGVQRAPLKLVVYGSEGVGKSTFCAAAPNPIFLDAESGTLQLAVDRVLIKGFENGLDAVADILDSKYKTVVFDSADAFVELATQELLIRTGWESIESPGYGRGYVEQAEIIRELLRAADACIGAGKNVVFIVHASIQRFADPAGDSFDRWTLSTPKKISPLLSEWCDTMLFADHDRSIITKKGDFGQEKKVAKEWGARIAFTEHRGSHDAKNRFNLPEKISLDWKTFEGHVNDFYKATEKRKGK